MKMKLKPPGDGLRVDITITNDYDSVNHNNHNDNVPLLTTTIYQSEVLSIGVDHMRFERCRIKNTSVVRDVIRRGVSSVVELARYKPDLASSSSSSSNKNDSEYSHSAEKSIKRIEKPLVILSSAASY